MTTSPGRSRPLPVLVVAVAALAALVALVGALSGFGSRWGLWDFRTGFTILGWAAYAAIGVAVLSLPLLWLTRPGGPWQGFAFALFAFLVSLPVFIIPWQWQRTAREAPPIHDITTDTRDPPEFVDVVPLRADASNPVEYPGPEVAELQREAYPDLEPVYLDEPPEAAFHRALDAVAEMGWSVVGFDAEEGRIEATDRTFWFGFRDDVVIRIRPEADRTRVDVRSKSRVGRGDVGTNARRIRSYLSRLAR